MTWIAAWRLYSLFVHAPLTRALVESWNGSFGWPRLSIKYYISDKDGIWSNKKSGWVVYVFPLAGNRCGTHGYSAGEKDDEKEVEHCNDSTRRAQRHRRYYLEGEEVHVVGEEMMLVSQERILPLWPILFLDAIKTSPDDEVASPDGVEFLDAVSIFDLEAKQKIAQTFLLLSGMPMHRLRGLWYARASDGWIRYSTVGARPTWSLSKQVLNLQRPLWAKSMHWNLPMKWPTAWCWLTVWVECWSMPDSRQGISPAISDDWPAFSTFAGRDAFRVWWQLDGITRLSELTEAMNPSIH